VRSGLLARRSGDLAALRDALQHGGESGSYVTGAATRYLDSLTAAVAKPHFHVPRSLRSGGGVRAAARQLQSVVDGYARMVEMWEQLHAYVSPSASESS